MRWEALFDDFEAQAAEAVRAQFEAHVGELARTEQSAATLADRLRGQGSASLDFELRGNSRFSGRVVTVAETWCSIESGPRAVLIPLAAVVSVAGLARRALQEPIGVRRQMGITSALRALARDRSSVACHLDTRNGEPRVATGMIDGVGRDYLELASSGEGVTRSTTLVPLGALVAVASQR
ncbi:hypothetical protein SPF06_00085 [Sinomonas sp. JGH33]|uniref:Fis family transcriptional regulator n=1 Tax=Sinomonas terricola TaxID=3110330 RepID=A0ABU5T0C9_9MICC|nr:hypothetical protein [Sinomonas sp. JGH33]MEA5453106.1 hypothetical protein [Sinomonas sp. JGH33]